ncbi:SusC/RagA family TonB-linked outer membrane protein [Mucilaginibacter sp. CSA2-8R]|uniref:SusC/RagA family TonB-linked outer membrane protein n=1 Tax=Mucilaginibacter sp. CSA2-8R TaxID=3141542 RepID=UPI00315D7CD9
MKYILFSIIFVSWSIALQAQHIINGKVLGGPDSTVLTGATIKVLPTGAGTVTNNAGAFMINAPLSSRLLIRYLGFKPLEYIVGSGQDHNLIFLLQPDPAQLKEVVISTGYQELPKERATGSFVQVDQPLLNRSVSTSVIDRLADVVPGLTFNKVGNKVSEQTAISIRGQSTLFAQTSPLIILDNYPYDGDINNINPNDVEGVTILKDAAAASIWGARAGNGVIVITTKKGRYNQATNVSFNSNVTVGQRPDAFYSPVMSVSDFIETEKTLFSKGYYNNQERNANKIALTPVVELLIAKRDGKMSAVQTDAAIEALRSKDVRKNYERYLYQPSINQQYSLSINGGSAGQKFYLSAGYDHNRNSTVGNGYERMTLDANHSYLLANKKLTINSSLFISYSNTPQNGLALSALNYATGKLLYPYASLADEQGNGLAVTHTYRDAFLRSANANGLLDWQYKPLEELSVADQRTGLQNIRTNINLKYNLATGLSAQLLYQFDQLNSNYRNLQSVASWYTRDQINRLSILNSDGSITRPVPLGGILDIRHSTTNSHNLRFQTDYYRNWTSAHQLNLLAGAEVRDIHAAGSSYRYYGYDNEHASSQPVDYISTFTSFVNPASRSNKIQNNDALTDLTDRFVSYYANGSYTYQQRYILTGSIRLDQSNLFGVSANQKGTPLYSAGLSWNISDEPFYKVNWLPSLRLRFTYGSNGNVDRTLSAYTTAFYYNASNSYLNLPYAVIANPPNPELRWERVNIANLGLDFEALNARITGMVEYYTKAGKDLIGNAPLAPQTGVAQFKGNTANTQGKGVDLTLTAKNLNGAFKWHTTYLFTWSKDIVSKYLLGSTNTSRDYLSGLYSTMPTEGKPLYGVYSYPWAGLDPATGDPQGYLNGVVSKDYGGIIAASTKDNITYHGSARPVTYGALRNTFSLGNFSVSANITYRLGYFVRLSSIQYATVLSGLGGHGDYSDRWQRPGDEQRTQIPSMPSVINTNRDNFYTYSSALVAKGDHIRLQDITASYELTRKHWRKLPFKTLRIYGYANNLGILWKAMKGDLDPDAVNGDTLPLPKTIALGLKADL